VFIRAGTVLHVDIDFVGEPIPDVTWTLNGSELRPDNRTTITSIGYHTIMNRVNSKRVDSGTYSLTLRNSSGTDQGSFNVTVLGNELLSRPCVYRPFCRRSRARYRQRETIRRYAQSRQFEK